MIMIDFVNKIISIIKQEDYHIDNNISIYDLIGVIWTRIGYIIRGMFKKIFIKKSGKHFFAGKCIKIKHGRRIIVGNGVTFGNNVELNALSKKGISIGNNVNIGDFSVIRCTGSLKKIGEGVKIGNNCGLGDYCFLGAAGGIIIGDDVIMGQNVRFHSENHKFDKTDELIRKQGVFSKGIIIEKDCWIGSGVVFLDGIVVGEGCVIGANALVNKNIPSYSVAVGNPVRVVKNRKSKRAE